MEPVFQKNALKLARGPKQTRPAVSGLGFNAIAASFGIFGGILSLAVGLFCVFIHAFMPAHGPFGPIGTVLLISGIPLLLVGSIFLDVGESR